MLLVEKFKNVRNYIKNNVPVISLKNEINILVYFFAYFSMYIFTHTDTAFAYLLSWFMHLNLFSDFFLLPLDKKSPCIIKYYFKTIKIQA